MAWFLSKRQTCNVHGKLINTLLKNKGKKKEKVMLPLFSRPKLKTRAWIFYLKLSVVHLFIRRLSDLQRNATMYMLNVFPIFLTTF